MSQRHRLGFHVLLLATLGALSLSADATSDDDLKSGLEFCCETGAHLNSCTDRTINATSHETPIGICFTTMKLCCLLKQKNPICDKDFVVTSFDRFCDTPSTKYESCCLACQIGHELYDRDRCDGSNTNVFKLFNSIQATVREIISECRQRKKRLVESGSTTSESPWHRHRGFQFKDGASDPEDINECAIINNGCEESQDCVNTFGSYVCVPRSICKKGFQLNPSLMICEAEKSCEEVFNQTITEISPPTITHIYDSDALESKLTQNFPLTKVCPSGFKFNRQNQTCGDIDECKSMPRVCEHFCENLKGSFRCHCQRGYQINRDDSRTCHDVNECESIRNICSHDCHNVRGSFRCRCPKGFGLGINKRTCEDINECFKPPRKCFMKICNNLIGSFACYDPSCPEGFMVYHRKQRNEFNKCVRKSCSGNATCWDQPKYLVFKNFTLSVDTKVNRTIVLHNIDTNRFKRSFEAYFTVDVIKGSGNESVTRNDFGITQQPSRALITLKKAFASPVEVQIVVKTRNKTGRVIEVLTISLSVHKR